MSLSLSASSLPELAVRTPAAVEDPHRRHWGPVTVRIVWDLVGLGIKPRPQLLREVREHALLSLGEHADTLEAEDVASAALVDWLKRREGKYDPVERSEVQDILPDPRWRLAVLDGCEPLHEAVFKLAYGDGVLLEDVVRRVGVEAAWVRASVEALRSIGRAVVAEDGVSTEGWTDAHVDTLLARIANAAGNACPGPEGLLTDLGRAHAEHCPRCNRAHRLIAGGFLSPNALFAPEDGPTLAASSMDLLCLQLHPDARRHARVVREQFGDHGRLVRGELLLINVPAVPDLEDRLAALTERGVPRLEHLRGVRGVVRAQWGRQAVLGPGPMQLVDALKSSEWGAVHGVGALPEVLPPPASPLRWYGSLVLAALIAVAAGLYSWTHSALPPRYAVTGVRQHEQVIFDTEDAAYVDVVAVDGRVGSALFHSAEPADKGAIATGDGRYAVESNAEYVAVVTADQPIENVVGLAALAENPRRFAAAVQDAIPGAGVTVLARPAAVHLGPITIPPELQPWR
jgi:hypothetical protein